MRFDTIKILAKCSFAAIFLNATLSVEQAAASGDSAALTFLKSAGCTQLPMGTCDMLDADNAQNIMTTYRAVLLSKFCGSINVNEARQMLASDNAADPAECRELLSVMHAL